MGEPLFVWKGNVVYKQEDSYAPGLQSIPNKNLDSLAIVHINGNIYCKFCHMPIITSNFDSNEGYEYVDLTYSCEFCGYAASITGYADSFFSGSSLVENILLSFSTKPEDDVCTEINKVLDRYINRISNTSPFVVEEIIASIYKEKGYRLIMTSKTRDGGVDFYLFNNNMNTCAVQVKRYKKKVGVSAVRELLGVQLSRDIKSSKLVITSEFSKQAIQEANSKNIRKLGYSIDLVNVYDILKELQIFNTKDYTLSQIKKRIISR